MTTVPPLAAPNPGVTDKVVARGRTCTCKARPSGELQCTPPSMDTVTDTVFPTTARGGLAHSTTVEDKTVACTRATCSEESKAQRAIPPSTMKPTPQMVTTVDPSGLTTPGTRPYNSSGGRKTNGWTTCTRSFPINRTTVTDPTLSMAGVVHCMASELATVAGTSTDPNLHLQWEVAFRLVPVKVTNVPPIRGPDSGNIDATVAVGTYKKAFGSTTVCESVAMRTSTPDSLCSSDRPGVCAGEMTRSAPSTRSSTVATSPSNSTSMAKGCGGTFATGSDTIVPPVANPMAGSKGFVDADMTGVHSSWATTSQSNPPLGDTCKSSVATSVQVTGHTTVT